MAKAHINSIFWGHNQRIEEAYGVPFRSIYSRDSGDPAVTLVKRALLKISRLSSFLPARLLPHPFGSNGPPGAQWGPFHFKRAGTDPTQIEPGPVFNELADAAVRKFQRQDGTLDVDGKVGMATMARLDEIVDFVDDLPDDGGDSSSGSSSS